VDMKIHQSRNLYYVALNRHLLCNLFKLLAKVLLFFELRK
jgi:hypothetical protein